VTFQTDNRLGSFSLGGQYGHRGTQLHTNDIIPCFLSLSIKRFECLTNKAVLLMVNTNSHYHRSYEIFSTAARWLIEIWSIEPGHSFFQTSKAVESPRTASEGFSIVSTSHISNYSSHSAEELVIYPINHTTTFSPTYPTPVSRPYCYSWPISNPSPSYSSQTHPRPSPLPTAQKHGTESALWSPNLKPQRRKQCRDSYSSVLLGIKSPSNHRNRVDLSKALGVWGFQGIGRA